MSTPFGLEHQREHPVVDADGNPVVEQDPTLLPRDPDGTEADASAEAEFRAGGADPGQPAGQVAEPIVLPAGPDAQDPLDPPSHRKDTPIDAPVDLDAAPGTGPAVERDEPLTVPSGRSEAPYGSADQPVLGDLPEDVAPETAMPEEVLDTAPARVDESAWLELQGTFVDDPQEAVRQAADLLDRAIADLRRDLGSTDSTEDLRHAFRRYRDVYRSLR